VYVEHTEPDMDPSPEDFRWQRNYLVRTADAAAAGYHPSRNNWGPLVVPRGNYFVWATIVTTPWTAGIGACCGPLVKGRPL